jgi:hypothetical protein
MGIPMICIDDVTPTINNPQYSHGWCIPSANGRLMALGLITILDDIDIYIDQVHILCNQEKEAIPSHIVCNFLAVPHRCTTMGSAIWYG